MFKFAKHMGREWTNPPGHEALDLSLLGEAIYTDGAERAKDAESDFYIPLLSHPLYHQIFYHPIWHEWANQCIRQKEQGLRRMIETGKPFGILWLYERPYRANIMNHIYEWLDGGDIDAPPGFPDAWDGLIEPLWEACMNLHDKEPWRFWGMVREAWTDNENIPQELEIWEKLWKAGTAGGLWMSDTDEKRMKELPKTVELWRGGCNDGGWSHTLDEGIARFFAKRPYNEPTGEVIHLRVPKDAIYCFIGERNEEEIIILEEDLTEWELNRYKVKVA